MNTERKAEEERAHTLLTLLLEGEVDEFDKTVRAMPELKNRTENGSYVHLMPYVLALNELDLAKYLNDNCGDCNLEHSGYRVVDFMGRTYEGKPWKSMNADTFRYVYENGGVRAFLRKDPRRSIFVHVADYWIPESGSIYSDYSQRKDDNKYGKKRGDQKLKMLEYLIEQGHSANEIDAVSDDTAMLVAAQAQDMTMIDFLVDRGAKTNAGRNPLAVITRSSSLELVKKLLELGYDPNEVTPTLYASPKSTTLLGRIVEGGEYNPELLALLEDYEVDFDLRDSYDKAPIDYAFLEFDRPEKPFTEYLVGKGAEKTDNYYYSTLVYAIQNRNHDLITSVLSSHPHLANGLKDDEETYPLERAVWSKDLDSFKLLLDAGARIHDEDYFATKLFEGAISRQNYDIAQVILDTHPTLPVSRPGEIDGKQYLMSHALGSASDDGNMEWVNKLIKLGSKVESKHLRNSPLWGAVLNGHVEVVKLLVDAGFPSHLVDDKGESLLDHVEESATPEMLELLNADRK